MHPEIEEALNNAGPEFHIPNAIILKNGKILYTFRKGGYEKASGSYPLDKFIPQLERYLLIGNS